jgi:hypothetical protein
MPPWRRLARDMTLPPSEALPETRQAARLGAFARGLGCSVGIERSCKLRAHGVDAGRFLLSFGADERTARLTAGLLREMSFPAHLEAAFEAAASEARFLHLGYEGGRSGAVLKVYCEGDPERSADVPHYTAYKWSPSVPVAVAIDDYRLRPGLDIQGMGAAMSVAFGASAANLAQACRDLLGRVRAEQVMWLDVVRRGGIRRSFDLRLYGADLRLNDVRPLIETAQDAFGLDDAPLRLLASADAAALGHLSGGRDDQGAAFLTLYFGAEAFA